MSELKKYWNGVGSTKTFTIPFRSEVFAGHVNSNAKVLDYGCGYGRVIAELRALGYQNLIGIDYSEQMIQRAKELNPGMQFVVNKGEEIPLKNNSIDAVVLLAVLTCIPASSDQKKLLAEIRRVLRPQGALYIGDYLINSDERNLKRYEQFADSYGQYGVFKLPEGGVFRHHSKDWIYTLLQDFVQELLVEEDYITMNGNQSRGFTFLGRVQNY